MGRACVAVMMVVGLMTSCTSGEGEPGDPSSAAYEASDRTDWVAGCLEVQL